MADGLCLVNNTDSSNTSAKKTETASNQMDNSIVKLNEKLLNEQKSVCVTIVDCFGAMKNSVETQKCEQKMSEKNQLLLSCGSSGSGVVTNTTTTTTNNNNITANATVVDNNDDKNNQQNSDVVNSENESMIKTAAAVTSLNNVNNKNNVKSNKNSAVHCVEKPIIKPSNLDGLLIKPIGLHKLTDLKPPQSQKDIDDKRKKRRCQDRYDSSESSDSGVATLSCTDSSTASSDVSDPGSPYSPLSCDDNNQLSSGVSVGSMPPLQQQHQHQQQRTASSTAAAIPSSQNNWSWSTNFVGLNVGGNSNNNNNINLINNNNNCNTKIKRNSAPEQQTSTLKTTPIVSIKRCRTLSLDKTFIAAPPPTKPITQSKPTVDNVTPQTKITGFFKSQIKPVNGLKRDLSNLVSSSDLSAKQIKKNCDIDVRTLTTMPPLIKKVERKSAKIAPLAPITRKNLSKKQQQQQQQILSPPKKPVTIAPRASAANNNSIAKRLNPPPLIPKLPDSHPQQQLQKSPLDQQSPKLTSPTVLLTTIRLPHHQQQHQQQIIQHNQPKIAAAKMGSIFQLHAAPIPMPKLVQIPNILSKDQTTNLLMNNNGQLTRINNGGSHYFLNGAVIKLQQLSSQQTNGQQQPQTNVDMLQMKSSQQSIGDTVPFTSKSLPPPLQQQQQQSQVQNNAHFVSANATNAHQYAQPVFMATSSGLLLSTALPTVITSQISGLQQQQQHQQINQQHSAIPALHPFNQPTSNILPSINTILQNHHHNHSTSYVTSQQQNNCYQLHTTTETSHHQLLQQQHQQHFSQTITQQRMIANIPQPLVSINTNLPSKIPHPSYATSCQSPAQIFIATTMPALITTSTPTTSSITSLCMSPKESTLPQQKLPPPLLKFDEMPELTKFKLKIETALPTMPVLVPQPPPNQVKPQSLTNNSQCPTTNASELMDLCSPAVPLLSPKVDKTLLPPQCLASPKSLVLEKIQQKISDNLDDSGIAITPKKQSLPINDVLLLKTPKIETEFQTASLPECAKSPILSQPKTIRFPAMNNGNGPICGGIRKSDGRVIGACYWDDCNVRYDTSSKLLDHLQTQHVNSQSGPFTCQWSGCKVHGRESCSRRWLERHVLSHGGTKQFKCIVDGCGLRFGSQLALQKHVNGHFTTTETKDPAARRSSDPPVPKKLRVNGKKLRYRRQPFSARMFDYFDNGIMEALQHRLAHTMATASGPGGSVSFTGQLQGRRTTNEGRVEFLIKWNPSDILPDEWMAESLARESLVKAVNIQTMSSEQRYLLHKYIKKSYKKNNSTNAANAAGDEDCSNFTNGPISESFSSSSLSSTSSSFASSPIVTPTTKRHRKQPKKMPS